mmetsp:Transcript_12571/g.35838  ORF Transcript_12571/g.35838 Transcript_12571/m.35838 type:complete len:211 (-) Transcript_12571:1159-1791(-)
MARSNTSRRYWAKLRSFPSNAPFFSFASNDWIIFRSRNTTRSCPVFLQSPMMLARSGEDAYRLASSSTVFSSALTSSLLGFSPDKTMARVLYGTHPSESGDTLSSSAVRDGGTVTWYHVHGAISTARSSCGMSALSYGDRIQLIWGTTLVDEPPAAALAWIWSLTTPTTSINDGREEKSGCEWYLPTTSSLPPDLLIAAFTRFSRSSSST